MAPYSITMIEPEGYSGARSLEDMKRLLELSLASLGHQRPTSTNTVTLDAKNILLGYQLLESAEVLPKDAYLIIYQLEQLSDHEGWFTPARREILQRADEIWDYSLQNIGFLEAHGITTAKHLPIGWHPGLETVPDGPEDIDILFYGSVNERRGKLLQSLADQCRIEVLCGKYGAERDAYIGRAKIVLNLHFYDGQVQEQARISYLLNNRRFVLSETSKDDAYGAGIAQASYETIVERAAYYLNAPQARESIAKTGYTQHRERSMSAALKTLL